MPLSWPYEQKRHVSNTFKLDNGGNVVYEAALWQQNFQNLWTTDFNITLLDYFQYNYIYLSMFSDGMTTRSLRNYFTIYNSKNNFQRSFNFEFIDNTFTLNPSQPPPPNARKLTTVGNAPATSQWFYDYLLPNFQAFITVEDIVESIMGYFVIKKFPTSNLTNRMMRPVYFPLYLDKINVTWGAYNAGIPANAELGMFCMVVQTNDKIPL